MVRVFDIVPGAAEESRSKLEDEFDWLEEKLADGRTYLVGDRFSRADLTVASLLAQFARPRELDVHHTMSGSDSLAARWSRRPIMRWVRSQYEMHRAG
jgi:glutathione S-transferase